MADEEIIDEPGISVCSLGINFEQMKLLSEALEKGESVCIEYNPPFKVKFPGGEHGR